MEESKLTGPEMQLLLKTARKAIERELAGLPFSIPRVTNTNLLEYRGAFVTIHKHGRLRGCIGTFSADRPLYEVVGDMAISAAFKDLRFRPLGPSEFEEIDLEISALTPLMPVVDINKIETGIHGIYIVQGPFHGVLLPQVATKNRWDRLHRSISSVPRSSVRSLKVCCLKRITSDMKRLTDFLAKRSNPVILGIKRSGWSTLFQYPVIYIDVIFRNSVSNLLIFIT